jgi:hypothetical protein
MLLSQSASSRSFRLTMMLAGITLGVGLFVVLRYAQIPFYLYYPRSTDTILLSGFLDTCLFALTTLSVPASLVILVLQAKHREQSVSFGGFALALAVVVWLPSFAFVWNQPFLSALGLYASTITMAAVNLLVCGRLHDLDQRRAVSDMLIPMVTIFALVEFATLYHWIFSSIYPRTQIGLQAAELEANLTYSPFLLAPFFLIALLFSWLWVPPALRLPKASNWQEITPKSVKMPDRRTLAASIDLIAILAIVVTYYPYFAGQHWLVGVDSRINYYDPLTSLGGLSLSQGMLTLSSTFHGVYVGLLFLLERTTSLDPFLIVKFAPLILAFLTAIIIYWIFLDFTKSQRLALLSAACSILWIPTTLGVYTGVQSNWTALVLWLLFLALMLRSTKSRSRLAGIVALQAIASAGILAIHPWTWGVFVATLAIFAVIVRLTKPKAAGASLRSLLSALALAVPAGGAGILFVLNIRKEALNAMQTYLWALSRPNQMLFVGGAIYLGFVQWASFLSPLILAICLLGTLRLAQRNDKLSKYLLAWLIACSVGSILAARLDYDATRPELSEPQLWRMLFISPLPILLAFGIEKAWELLTRLKPVTPTRFRADCAFASIFPTALCGALLVISGLPIVKLLVVLAALACGLLLAFKQGPHAAKTLLIMTLLLVVINAAFRSLYPLLLDPHNLTGSWPSW